MTFKNPLKDLLDRKGCIILDGALATELEARGLDITDDLWSAKVLLDDPEVIYQVHLDYFKAGADVAITSSYQATHQGLAKRGFDAGRSHTLIQQSARLAQRARDKILESDPNREMLIAGSVGPYGAYLADGSEYRGDYHVPFEEMKDFHRPRVNALLDAHVDLLACETMPSFAETAAIIELLKEFQDARAWFSFTLKDEEHISDDTPLESVCELLNKSPQVVAVGINCVDTAIVNDALKLLKSLTERPLLVYPNSGEAYDAQSNTWHGCSKEKASFEELVPQWRQKGACIIGGCCRTTPKEIRSIKACTNP